MPRIRPAIVALTAAALTLGAAAIAGAADAPRFPMLEAWAGPFGGVPAWNSVKVEDFVPAFDVAMDEQRAEIKRIAENPDPPTFENTIVALERAGEARRRLSAYYGVHASTLNTGPMPDVQKTMAPRFAAFADEITQNEKLFRRVAAVYEGKEYRSLDPTRQRLTWNRYRNFVRAGARLDSAQKTRLSAINQRLASLYNRFGQNVLDDETKRFTVLDDASGLTGLPDDLKGAAARAAKAHGQEGKWVIANTRSAVDPFLTYASDRGLRERVWRTFVNRGDNADSTDNNQVITEILQLRFERANLLGYKSHAHWRLEPQMAGTPERALALMESVWTPAVAAVHRDVDEMQKMIDAEKGGFELQPWDYRYYAEKLRKQKYDLDFNEVKPYLQIDKLREGMHWAAGRLYGLKFTRLENVASYHPDVTVWEVTGSKGEHVGLWYFDPYAREGKRSGAWMSQYRPQERLRGAITPIVSNNANFVKGEPGAPLLISWDDATTMFHEFGHALHGLLSNVQYPSQAGSSTARDFVEFPSQLNEHWFSTPEVLQRFALHYQTGRPMPAELLERIKRAENFNEGFRTMEYLASAMMDMKYHLAGAGPIDPRTFEREELEKLGQPKQIVMRHRSTQFNHVFSGDGYSAGYYSYLWADALTADAWEAFEEGKGPWDPQVAARLRKTILSTGDTMDQAEEFRLFRGRDVDTAALMRSRGFAPPKP
jgi:peptidyl-dipeptidase Dcp